MGEGCAASGQRQPAPPVDEGIGRLPSTNPAVQLYRAVGIPTIHTVVPVHVEPTRIYIQYSLASYMWIWQDLR